MREFSRASMGIDAFRQFCDEVYNIDEGQTFRKRDRLDRAFMSGYGWEYAPWSIWAGINAITQVETSTRGTTAAKGRAQFARGTFGAGAQIRSVHLLAQICSLKYESIVKVSIRAYARLHINL